MSTEEQRSKWRKSSKKYYKKQKTRDERIMLIYRLSGTGCIACGDIHPPHKMDFHHLPNFVKLFNINLRSIVRNTIWDIIDELKKCVCVCANCHREVEYGDEIDPEYLYANRITEGEIWSNINAASVRKTW